MRAMPIRLSAVVFLVLAVVGGSALAAMPNAATVKWQHLVVTGTGLAVDMPGTPVKGDDLTIGSLRSVAYRLESGETRAYGVRAEQIPADELTLEGADGLFDDIRDGMLADGTLRAEWSLRPQGGAVGRGLIIDSAVKSGPDSYTTIAHIYVHGDWIYELVATVPRGGDHDPVALRFLNSARFAGK